MPFSTWAPRKKSSTNCKGSLAANDRLFLHLEHSKRPTSLSNLVEAFGWTRETTFVQQDIQEFCCLLMDNLEKKFSDKEDFVNPFAESPIRAEDPRRNLIQSLFNGQTEQVISCRDVEFSSTRKEDFIDIQLSLKSFTKSFYSIEDSLDEFLAKEELTGDNQYATEKWGKQDADRRVRFLHLPKVLMFHLRRCEFDFQTEINKKIKHRFSFPQVLDMNRFREPEFQIEGGNPYDLYCIFVHHGNDGIAGHYTVLLREDGQWFEFDDEQVRVVDWEFVKRNAYGGEHPDLTLEKRNLKLIENNKKTISHAYMIIYIDRRYKQGRSPANRRALPLGQYAQLETSLSEPAALDFGEASRCGLDLRQTRRGRPELQRPQPQNQRGPSPALLGSGVLLLGLFCLAFLGRALCQGRFVFERVRQLLDFDEGGAPSAETVRNRLARGHAGPRGASAENPHFGSKREPDRPQNRVRSQGAARPRQHAAHRRQRSRLFPRQTRHGLSRKDPRLPQFPPQSLQKCADRLAAPAPSRCHLQNP